jgi:hypothetical protein
MTREPAETTSALLGPVHIIIYVLGSLWLLLTGVCIIYEWHRRKAVHIKTTDMMGQKMGQVAVVCKGI